MGEEKEKKVEGKEEAKGEKKEAPGLKSSTQEDGEDKEDEASPEELENLRQQLVTGRMPVLIALDDTKYSVRMPTAGEEQETALKRAAYFHSLRGKPGMKTQAQIDRELSEEGIFTRADQERVRRLLTDLKVAKQKELAVVKDNEKAKIEALRKDISCIEMEAREIMFKKAAHYANSIEVLAKEHEIRYLVSCCAEKKVEGQWVPVWKSLEEFLKEKNTLLSKTMFESFIGLTAEGVNENFFGGMPEVGSGDLDTFTQKIQAALSLAGNQSLGTDASKN